MLMLHPRQMTMTDADACVQMEELMLLKVLDLFRLFLDRRKRREGVERVRKRAK